DDLLDGLALGGDTSLDVGPGARRTAPVLEGLLQAGDLALQPPHAGEGQLHRSHGLGLELAPLGQDDDVVGGDVAATETVPHVEQGADGHRNAGQAPAQRDLAYLDAAADRDL